jgi:NADPH2:quinone reductase
VHAIRQYEFGPPENLRYEQLADPQPDAGQVRVAVEAAGVHLVDTLIRRGIAMGPLPLPELPMTPGREVAGVVDATGPQADPDWLGRRVVAHLGPASGGYAERALAPAAALHEVPPRMSPEVAVAMIGTGRTAVAVLDLAAVTPNDVVLILAAAGGLGNLFVQAVEGMGATAVGLCGGAAKTEQVAALGATVAVDYLRPGWPDEVRAALAGRLPSVVLDGVSGALGRAAVDLLEDGGRLVQFGWASGQSLSVDPDEVSARHLTVESAVGARMAERAGGMRELETRAVEYAATGIWSPLVRRFGLARASAAHAALETRATVGKAVLVP